MNSKPFQLLLTCWFASKVYSYFAIYVSILTTTLSRDIIFKRSILLLYLTSVLICNHPYLIPCTESHEFENTICPELGDVSFVNNRVHKRKWHFASQPCRKNCLTQKQRIYHKTSKTENSPTRMAWLSLRAVKRKQSYQTKALAQMETKSLIFHSRKQQHYIP